MALAGWVPFVLARTVIWPPLAGGVPTTVRRSSILWKRCAGLCRRSALAANVANQHRVPAIIARRRKTPFAFRMPTALGAARSNRETLAGK